jgi:hypothetical protein
MLLASQLPPDAQTKPLSLHAHPSFPTIGNNVNENLSLTCPIKVAPAWRQTVMAQRLRPPRNASA